ncbi:MAG: OmpA family protein [Saprospiraceae bacterium]|nr:OmpA family protein [Saprospiraceae bacterium]
MQKILLALAFLLAPLVSPAQATISSVYFELGKHELSATARQTLDALALQLLVAPDYMIKIEAWTDDRGSESYNQRLATQRAEAVQQYLADRGLLPGKATVRSWGKQNPAYDNSTEEARQLNRRVDVTFSPVFFSDYRALQTRLSAPAEQLLRILPDREQQITAAKGTIIKIPPQAFVFEDGTAPTGPVELMVREAFSPSDFVLQNLTTLSDGRILQTGGMVYIGAQADGKPLRLAEGASLTVALPTRRADPNMELFYGETNPDNSINWLPTRQSFRQTMKKPRTEIEIDPATSARIVALQVPEYPEPLVPKFSGDLPPMPRKPVAPIAPKPPQKPTWENAQRKYGYGYGPVMNRMTKKRLKKAQKYYQTALANYERDSLSFIRLQQRYLNNLDKHQAALVAYETAEQKWKNEVVDRISAIIQFDREYYLHEYSKNLQTTIRYVGKHIQRYEHYSDLENAVENILERMMRYRNTDGLATANANRSVTKALYRQHIGSKIMDSPGYFSLTELARRKCGPDTLHRVTHRMRMNCGLVAISDSLRANIREKELLEAATTQDAAVALNAYVADVTRLGWINCDKFLDDPAERVQLVVNEPEDAMIYAVCRDISSILPLNRYKDGSYSVSGLPKGRKVSVVSIKLKEGVPFFAMRDARAGDADALNMEYKSMTLRDLKEELKKLNI